MGNYTIADMLAKPKTFQGPDDSRIAVTFGDEHRTYRDLDEASDRIAAGLLAEGFGHGDRVGVLMYNRIEWIELFFAIAKIGGVLVPINYLLKPAEVDFILRDCGARWLVHDDALAATVERLPADEAPRRVSVGAPHPGALFFEHLRRTDPVSLPGGIGEHDLLLLQYTSGTTGFPKGAMHTHSTVMWNSYHQIADFGITSEDVYLVIPALCWAAGFHDLALATLWAGGRIVLNPSTNFDPARFFATVERERVTKTLLVPSVLKRVLAAEEMSRHDLSSLSLVISGGEPVPVSAIEELSRRLPGCALLQVYGMSEFPTLMIYLTRRDALRKIGSTGKACSVAWIRVVDPDGTDVEPGRPGEIIVRSPACMIGYYNRPEETAKTIVDGWMHTGDIATVDEDGYVYISGRAKDMIITGGLNVYPAEVERVIAEHPDVAEAAVIGLPDDRWGEIGEAHVVLHPGRRLGAEQLREWLAKDLATYKIPRRYVFTERPLPRTTSGKIKKFMLREAR